MWCRPSVRSIHPKNLGNAISKGIDLQADIQVTDAFSIESSLRLYGCALHHEHLSGAGAKRASGSGRRRRDRRARTASEPVTRFRPTRFPWGWNTSSAHSTMNPMYAVTGSISRGTSGSIPPRIPTPHPMIRPVADPAAGVSPHCGPAPKFGDWGVALFVDNLTDSHTILNYNHQTNAYSDGGNLLASPAYDTSAIVRVRLESTSRSITLNA